MRRWLSLLFGTWLLAACAPSESDPGLHAQLRVLGAQYVRGALPAVGTGPMIASLLVPHAQVRPGLRRELLTGSLPIAAESVLIALDGDAGYWIVTASAPAIEAPDLPTFTAELSFARELPAGALTLGLSAVQADGAVGPRRTVALFAEGHSQRGFLSVELQWDTESDLDLHVLVPDGTELWSGNLNTYTVPPPGASAPDPDAYRQGGTLDLDSNGNCVLDGRRAEQASWPAQPASGTYSARVATASLCSESVAHWTLEVWLAGQLLQRVQGLSQSGDTRLGAGLGAGVLAVEFSVP